MPKRNKRKHNVVRDGQVANSDGVTHEFSFNFKKPKSPKRVSSFKTIPEYQKRIGELEVKKAKIQSHQAQEAADGFEPSLDLKIQEDALSKEQMALRNEVLSQLKNHPANDLNLNEPLNRTETISVAVADRNQKAAAKTIEFDDHKKSIKITSETSADVLSAYKKAGITGSEQKLVLINASDGSAWVVGSIIEGKPVSHLEIRNFGSKKKVNTNLVMKRFPDRPELKWQNKSYLSDITIENPNNKNVDVGSRKKILKQILIANNGMDNSLADGVIGQLSNTDVKSIFEHNYAFINFRQNPTDKKMEVGIGGGSTLDKAKERATAQAK